MAATDNVIFVNTNSSSVTLTLPVPTNGRVFEVKDSTGNASTHNIIVQQHASEKIDGQNSITLNANYAYLRLISDGTNWFTNENSSGGDAITALTGDATASGPGSATITLATVNSNVGSFGSSTAIPSFTVNAKGLITAASTNVVVAPAGTLTGTTLASNVVSSSLTTVGGIAQNLLPDANNTRDLGVTGTRWANLWLGGNATVTGTISGSNFSGSSSGTNTGDVTLSAFGSSPNSNGASLSGQALTLQPADASNPGGVSTTAQTFAGNKRFNGILSVNGAATTVAQLEVAGNSLSGVNQIAIYTGGFVSTSAATTSVRGFSADVSTASSAFTSTFVSAFLGGVTAGSGSTITRAQIFDAFGGITATGTITNSAIFTDNHVYNGNFAIHLTSTNPSVLSGSLSATALIPTGSTVPANGMYLSASNTVAFATNTTLAGSISSNQAWVLGASGSTQTQLINGGVFEFTASSGSYSAKTNLGFKFSTVDSNSGASFQLSGVGDATHTNANFILASIASAADTGSTPVMQFDARQNGDVAVTTRPLFRWSNKSTSVGDVSVNGAWSWGSSGGSQTHTVYGNIIDGQSSADGTTLKIRNGRSDACSVALLAGTDASSSNVTIYGISHATKAQQVIVNVNGASGITVDAARNVVLHSAAISTSATDGFLYITSCAGTPTGSPSAFTGRVPMVYDSTNKKFYIYDTGSSTWKSVTLT